METTTRPFQKILACGSILSLAIGAVMWTWVLLQLKDRRGRLS